MTLESYIVYLLEEWLFHFRLRYKMWFFGYCSPRYESENRAGVYSGYSEKCQMQLSSVSSVEWCNQSLVCYFHTQYKTHECTQPKHDLIAQVSQFHCLVQRHLSWFNVCPHTARIIIRDHLQARQIPGTEWPTCSPDQTQSNSYGICWGMLCVASNLQDLRRILLEQWEAIPQIRIIRLIRSILEEKVPSYHGVFGGSTRYW